MVRLLQVLVVSFTIGMLASFGMASAELYMIQFGGFDNSYWLHESCSNCEQIDLLCNAGDKIISGSVEQNGGTSLIVESRPIFDAGVNSDQEGWHGTTEGINNPHGMQVWAHCLEPLSMTVGGMEIQPDTTALFLAYGIVNSYWIAPLSLGIGVGLYLTRNKWKRN